MKMSAASPLPQGNSYNSSIKAVIYQLQNLRHLKIGIYRLSFPLRMGPGFPEVWACLLDMVSTMLLRLWALL